MWFPDESPKIKPAKFKDGSKAVYRDKEKNDHVCTVVHSHFENLLSGYVYAIVLDEPFEGKEKLLVNEAKLFSKAGKTKK